MECVVDTASSRQVASTHSSPHPTLEGIQAYTQQCLRDLLMECVVDTASSRYVAIVTQMPAAAMEQSMPYMKISLGAGKEGGREKCGQSVKSVGVVDDGLSVYAAHGPSASGGVVGAF